MNELSGEAEAVYRWASQTQRAIQNAVPALEKARGSCELLRSLARKEKIEPALALRAKVESQIWQALGACIDPSKSNDEKIELARRVFGSHSVHVPPGVAVSAGAVIRRADQQELRFAREKIEALAHEVAKSRTLLVQSDQVLSALAERGWTAQKLARIWDEYLGEVLTKGKIGQKREAIRDFMEFVRGLEPKAVIEVESDLGTMSEDSLRHLQGQLAKVLLGAALPQES